MLTRLRGGKIRAQHIKVGLLLVLQLCCSGCGEGEDGRRRSDLAAGHTVVPDHHVPPGVTPPVATIRAVHVVLQDSLDTLAARISDDDLLLALSRAFAWTLDLRWLGGSDHMTAIYEEAHVDGARVWLHLLGARVVWEGCEYLLFGFARDDRPLAHYDWFGRSVRRPFLRAPIAYTRISSRYSLKRLHPIEGRYKPHLGTDFAAAAGTPIVATGAGTVRHAGYTPSNGWYVRIRHNTLYETAYLHMSRVGVHVGQVVQQGQIIGYVGASGAATGPHVCYRVWREGEPVDGLRLVQPPVAPLDGAELRTFRRHRDSLTVRLRALAGEWQGSRRTRCPVT